MEAKKKVAAARKRARDVERGQGQAIAEAAQARARDGGAASASVSANAYSAVTGTRDAASAGTSPSLSVRALEWRSVPPRVRDELYLTATRAWRSSACV